MRDVPDFQRVLNAANYMRLAMQELTRLTPAGQDVLLEAELDYTLRSPHRRPTAAEIDSYASLLVMTSQQLGGLPALGERAEGRIFLERRGGK